MIDKRDNFFSNGQQSQLKAKNATKITLFVSVRTVSSECRAYRRLFAFAEAPGHYRSLNGRNSSGVPPKSGHSPDCPRKLAASYGKRTAFYCSFLLGSEGVSQTARANKLFYNSPSLLGNCLVTSAESTAFGGRQNVPM